MVWRGLRAAMTEPNANEPEAAKPASATEPAKIEEDLEVTAPRDKPGVADVKAAAAAEDDESDDGGRPGSGAGGGRGACPGLRARARRGGVGRPPLATRCASSAAASPCSSASSACSLSAPHDAQLPFGVPLGFLLCALATFGICDLLGTFDDGLVDRPGVSPDEAVLEREAILETRLRTSMDLSALTSPLAQTSIAFVVFLGNARGRSVRARSAGALGFPRHRELPPLRRRPLPSRRHSRSLGQGRSRSRSPASQAPRFLGHRRRRAPLPAHDGQLFTLGSVGDPLRRGRPRDPLARRLDLALVGAKTAGSSPSRS